MRAFSFLKWVFSLTIVSLIISGVALLNGVRVVQAQSCTRALDVALVIDNSGTIDAGELSQLKASAAGVVGEFAVSDTAARFGVVVFNNSASIIQGLTGDSTTATSAINSINTSVGTTNISDALSKGGTVLGTDRGVPRVLVLFSDGFPEGVDTVDQALATANNIGGQGISIIGVGVGLNSVGRDFFARLSDRFIEVPGFGDLAGIVGALAGEICNPPPPRAGGSSCLTIPAGSVVGELTSTSRIYWAPGKISPEGVLQPTPDNKTFWVVGIDETGEYYKIILSCQYIWVPVGVMGPAFGDPVWQGAALPTNVVE
jgi:hypothetical protein